MEQKLILIIPFLFLSGCSCLNSCIVGENKPIIKTEKVYVPTPVPCPEPPVIEKPVLSQPVDSTPDAIIKATQIDLIMINKYISDLEDALNVYRKGN